MTADLCDERGDGVQVIGLPLRSHGGRRAFEGPVSTVRCHHDNGLVRVAVAEPGGGRVLVVDGGGSLARALVGDTLAGQAARNGWAGIVVHGAVRDVAGMSSIDIGVLALGTCPRRPGEAGDGERDVDLALGTLDGTVTVRPGRRLYADADGAVVEQPHL